MRPTAFLDKTLSAALAGSILLLLATSVVFTRWICLKQGRRPKSSRGFHRGNPQVGPPSHFIAMAMQLMMVLAAEKATKAGKTTMNWIATLFLAALITIAFAIYSDIAISRCEAGSFSAAVGLCSPGFK